MARTALHPRRLDTTAFARAGATLEARSPLAGLARLSAALAGREDVAAGEAVWRAEGERRSGAGGSFEDWLHLQVDAVVPLLCQRCLGIAQTPLAVRRSFRFVADNATAEVLDDELEEDVLAHSRAFDLESLVEDELLLHLPLVPRHEVCPNPLAVLAGPADPAADDARETPFAVLASIGGKRDP